VLIYILDVNLNFKC